MTARVMSCAAAASSRPSASRRAISRRRATSRMRVAARWTSMPLTTAVHRTILGPVEIVSDAGALISLKLVPAAEGPSPRDVALLAAQQIDEYLAGERAEF